MKKKMVEIAREAFAGRVVKGYFFDHSTGRRYGYCETKCTEFSVYKDSFDIVTEERLHRSFFTFDEIEDIELRHSDDGIFADGNLELYIFTKERLEARYSIGRG